MRSSMRRVLSAEILDITRFQKFQLVVERDRCAAVDGRNCRAHLAESSGRSNRRHRHDHEAQRLGQMDRREPHLGRHHPDHARLSGTILPRSSPKHTHECIEEIRINPQDKEGIQAEDWSFHQHRRSSFITVGYGLAFANDVGRICVVRLGNVVSNPTRADADSQLVMPFSTARAVDDLRGCF